jgi:hypothetical protein
MTYLEAVKAALFSGWRQVAHEETITGNGLQIVGYGLSLTAKQLFVLLVRAAVAVSAPLSALLIMYVDKLNVKYDAQADLAADSDI